LRVFVWMPLCGVNGGLDDEDYRNELKHGNLSPRSEIAKSGRWWWRWWPDRCSKLSREALHLGTLSTHICSIHLQIIETGKVGRHIRHGSYGMVWSNVLRRISLLYEAPVICFAGHE
jgi:hypothetical protein